MRNYGRKVYHTLRPPQQRFAQSILAPALKHLLLSDECINIGWHLSLDALPEEKGARQTEIALVLERLSHQGRLDECYWTIARGLAILSGPDRSDNDFLGATSPVRRLHTEPFIHFIAELFVQSFAGQAIWLIDPIAVSYAAIRLMKCEVGKQW